MLKNLWRTVRFCDMNRRVLLLRICASSCFCFADNSSQILKERIGLLAFATMTFNERKCGMVISEFKFKKTKFVFCWLCSLAGWKWLTNKLDEKKKQTHWQPEKRENPFRAVVKVLKRKIFSTSFSLFDFKTDRKNELKNKKTEFLFVNLCLVQRFDFKKKKIYI